jgi:hypothetical protein
MSLFQIQFIAGAMLGIEFPPCDEDESFVMTIDLLFVRIHYVKIKD